MEGEGDLDQYLVRRMEESGEEYGRMDDPAEEDVYTQLANKEKDLTLAAELGKALLEKNEELERMNSQLQEEYQMKLEELEQEKHDFRFRLESSEKQYEMVVKELQSDISMYRQEVENKENSMKSEERERYQVTADLRKHNERLTEQIRKCEEMAEELTSQNQSLREQLRTRHSTSEANLAQHEMLREEIEALSEKQEEGARRLEEAREEKEALNACLEESHQRIKLLEKQKQQKDGELQEREGQIRELKESNSVLEERLEDVYLQVTAGQFPQSNSLLSELQSQSNSLLSELQMSTENLDQLDRSTDSGRPSRHPLSPHLSLHELDDDDIECDDDVTDSAMVTGGSSCYDYDSGVLETSHSFDVRLEYIEAYKLVRSLLRKLRPPGAPQLPSPTDEGESEVGLLSLLQELREQVEELYHKAKALYEEEYVRSLDERIAELSVDLSASRNQMETLREAVREKDTQISQTGKQLDELNRRLSLQHQDVMRIQKERDAYTDQTSSPLTCVEQARRERDLAINKKNSMELDLVSVKLELASAERQLMEAIHQKIAISEQLEQCQMDFECVLDFQMQKRFHTEVQSPKHQPAKPSPTKRLFNFLS